MDLIVVTLFIKTCYNGFGRGLLAELFNLLGAVSITVLTVNYAGKIIRWVQPRIAMDPILLSFLGFWALFVSLLILKRALVKRLAEIVRWERLHWSIQGLGLLLGGIRGIWWSGFIVVVLTSSGFNYLRQSVEQESVLGPRLVNTARAYLQRVADKFPGAKERGEPMIPPAKTG